MKELNRLWSNVKQQTANVKGLLKFRMSNRYRATRNLLPVVDCPSPIANCLLSINDLVRKPHIGLSRLPFHVCRLPIADLVSPGLVRKPHIGLSRLPFHVCRLPIAGWFLLTCPPKPWRRWIVYCLLPIVFIACKEAKKHQPEEKASLKETYTCPMHPQIIKDKPGSCPVCGMDLVKKTATGEKVGDVTLNDLLRPSNQYVLSSIPTVHIQERDEPLEITTYGFITYDTRQAGTVSSNVNGRIEKLYVKYRYQKVNKGQKIMDVYSPELLTAQQNLLFLIQHDADNQTLISAARQKLLLLGMSNAQLEQVVKSGKPVFTVSIYSSYTGHIHESETMQPQTQTGMKDISLITEELTLKEGMYVSKAQNLFVIYNPSKAWAVLNIFSGQAGMVKVGDKVRISPETAPDKDFRAAINFIEPFYRPDSKTATARVYFNNPNMGIPIGSQVKAVIFAGDRSARWLPEESVLTLGLDKVVFIKKDDAFVAHKIEAGIVNNHLIQVLSGLSEEDEVAANAQYLVDSESFIKVKQ